MNICLDVTDIHGSASGDLMHQTSESLAGRIERITISGFSLMELGIKAEQELWLRGGFPLSFLATSESLSSTWRRSFVQTLLERDLPQWGVHVPAMALQRFWMMLAHYHGHIWNSAELARALGVSESTTRRYLDLLTHPKVGASWEGYVIEQVLSVEPNDGVFFWATHQGAEIDLVLQKCGKLFGVECKRADAPKLTPSIRIALENLELQKVAVLYPGTRRYSLSAQVDVVPLQTLAGDSSIFD